MNEPLIHAVLIGAVFCLVMLKVLIVNREDYALFVQYPSLWRFWWISHGAIAIGMASAGADLAQGYEVTAAQWWIRGGIGAYLALSVYLAWQKRIIW